MQDIKYRRKISSLGGLVLLFFTCLTGNASFAQQEELLLWPGQASGTDNWQFPETVNTTPEGDRIVSNVSAPSLAVYLPEAPVANGTAVIIAPGGALRVLGMDNEGSKVARWLNSRGIAAFVLKYRTLQTDPNAPTPEPSANPRPRQELTIRNGNANPEPDNAALREVLEMGIADARQALNLVRERADEWRIDRDRVGLMGFSAGGGVVIGATLAESDSGMPNFLVSLYGPSLQDVVVPEQAPPLFIAVGNNHFNVTNGCLALFGAWKSAGKPAEIHIYDQVSAGFGMRKQDLPVDDWIMRFYEWLEVRDLLGASG